MRFHLAVDSSKLPVVEPDLEWGPMIKRGRSRGDYQNPPLGSRAQQILTDTWNLVWPHLRARFKKHTLLSQTLARVPPGEPEQPFHCDRDGDSAYHTIIVPLTTEHAAGGTEFEDGVAFLAVRGIVYCFNGAVVHRGSAHRGERERIFASYVIHPNAIVDENIFV